MDLSRENIKKIRGLIIFTALLVVCLWKYDVVFAVLRFIFGVTFPFILGGAFAFVLNVPMNFIQRHLFPPKVTEKSKFMKKAARPLSMIAVILLVIGVVALVMLVLLPQLGSTLGTLGNSIQAFIPRVQKWAEDIFRDNDQISRWLGGLNFDWNRIMEVGMSFFSSGAGNMLDSTITVARSIISGLTTFFIAFVFACYILLQKEKLNVQVRKVLYAFVPRGKAEAALEVFSLTYSTFSSFLTGQCVEAIILGTMFVIAMMIFQMPYALLVGVLIAFTALIPIFGAFIGCAIGAFMIFMVDPVRALGFIVLFLVLQQIEGNFIYPHVVGNSVGLPSIWVLAAVSLGGSLMGVVGMLIFIPIVSVVYALFREIVYLKLKKQQITPEEIEAEVKRE